MILAVCNFSVFLWVLTVMASLLSQERRWRTFRWSSCKCWGILLRYSSKEQWTNLKKKATLEAFLLEENTTTNVAYSWTGFILSYYFSHDLWQYKLYLLNIKNIRHLWIVFFWKAQSFETEMNKFIHATHWNSRKSM